MDLWVLGKEPINPDQPTGADIRYEPEFEELQAEIDKLSSPTAASGVDWNKVVKLSSEILAQKSKDLLVASYLAVSLIRTQQLEGLAISLRVFSDLLDQFWEDLFPPKKRMRGRLGAIDWWLEKSEAALAELKPDTLPPEQQEQLSTDLEKIDQLLGEHLDEPPVVRGIREFINSIPTAAEEKPEPEAEPPPPPEEAKTPEVKEEAPREQPAEISEEIASAKDAQRVMNFGFQKIRQAAVYLREDSPANPQPYRLTRLAAWSKVTSLPPAADGQTQIPPPEAQAIAILKDLREKGEWEALLKGTETRLPQFIFWLDLNRLAAEALTNLGDQYRDAREAVCQETAFLVHRLAGLENLSFSDGTPFADNETRQWLRTIGLGAGVAMAESLPVSGTASSVEEDDLMAEEIQKAQALAKKNKLVEAVESLQQHLRNSASARERLLWRLALTQMLLKSKKPGLALPHLEQILQDIELYRLEEWDPALALRALKMALAGFNSQGDQASHHNGVEVLNRIARLDPAEAIRLGKG